MVSVPNRNDKRVNSLKTRARKLLYTKLKGFNGCVLIDDISYCKSDSLQLTGQQYYTARSRGGGQKYSSTRSSVNSQRSWFDRLFAVVVVEHAHSSWKALSRQMDALMSVFKSVLCLCIRLMTFLHCFSRI